MIWFLRSAAVACGVALTAVVLDLIASANAPKIGNCFPPGTWGDQVVGTIGGVGLVAGGVAVITGLISTVAPGHRALSIVLAVLGAGAALYCVGAGIGNVICEY